MSLIPSINAGDPSKQANEKKKEGKPKKESIYLPDMLEGNIENRVEEEFTVVIQQKVEDKTFTKLEEDFNAMTVLCYLKENKKQYLMEQMPHSPN